jgi:hypothetical protein
MASNAIRIVHIPRFRSTRPVWMYHELKQLYKQDSALPAMEVTTFRDIPSFRINKPQWLLDMNPNGKVPTMADDSVVMFEGGAICSYLLDRFDTGRKLLPCSHTTKPSSNMQPSLEAPAEEASAGASSDGCILLDGFVVCEHAGQPHRYFIPNKYSAGPR